MGAFAAFEFDNFRERRSEKRESALEPLKHEVEIKLHDTNPAIRKSLREMEMAFTSRE